MAYVILEWPTKQLHQFLSVFIAHSVVLYYSVLVRLLHFTLVLTKKIIERQIWLKPPPHPVRSFGHILEAPTPPQIIQNHLLEKPTAP